MAGPEDVPGIETALDKFGGQAVEQLRVAGRIAGADEHSVELRGVKREDLTSVARPYWVTAVGPIKEGG